MNAMQPSFQSNFTSGSQNGNGLPLDPLAGRLSEMHFIVCQASSTIMQQPSSVPPGLHR